MKKKNILTIALSLCLAAVIAVGATLAYFTDNTDKKTNTFVTGNVNISLTDDSSDPKAQDKEGNDGISFNDVMPGDTLQKKVSVTVLDEDKAANRPASSDAHVGILVKVTTTGDHPTADQIYTLVDDAVTRQETADRKNTWSDREPIYETVEGEPVLSGYLYTYNSAADPAWENGVPAGTELKLFSDIQIPSSWTNDYASASFDIAVQGYAIQADNLEAEDLAAAIQGTLEDSDGNVVKFEQVAD